MIPQWNVVALKMGELEVESSVIVFGRDYGKRMTIPIWAAAIYGFGHKILVDTGIDECEWIRRELGPCERKADEDIVSSIKKHLDWEPEDVDIVINTHLHHDHCGENRSFKNARFYVQEKEYRAAISPFPLQRTLYRAPLYNKNAVNYFDWVIMNGEQEIFHGLKVIPTPGHTVGHQSVLVNTAEGVLCISGDVSDVVDNINDNIPISFVISMEDELNSLETIRQNADFILTGHEPVLQYDGQREKFPIIKK